MEKFSQRMGIQKVNTAIQIDSMDEELRKDLWNDFYRNFWGMKNWGVFRNLIYDLWTNFFKQLMDEAPNYEILLQTIKKLYFSLEWNEVYDFIEFIANRFEGEYDTVQFVKACNITLKKNLSAYRFVEKKLVPVNSEQEIAEINEALSVSRTFTPHSERALNLLADRKAPDYANIIKESISAVEATCKLITGDPKATLGQALGRLESKRVVLHADLKDAFKKLYGYTSDAQGIRHGLVGKADLDVEDARFMLIACSAFINYLVVKADKAGIQLPDK